MLLDTALSLSDFLNANRDCFFATVPDFGEKGWVIVGERLPDGSRRLFRGTIADPAGYLRRAQAGIVNLDGEFGESEEFREFGEHYDLLARWLRLHLPPGMTDGETTGGEPGANGPAPKLWTEE